MDKEEARIFVRNWWASFSGDDRQNATTAITGKLKTLPEVQEARVIASYNPLEMEVDVAKFNHLLYAGGKDVYFPCVVEKDGGISYRQFSPYVQMQKDATGVLSPVGPDVKVDEIDVFIVPMRGFGRNLVRLGSGLGYYDKFFALEKTKVGAVKIGVAFSGQEVPNLPVCEWDIKMDMIVTEKEIIC